MGHYNHAHCTTANVGDVTQVQHLLHGHEKEVYGDSGYTGVENREDLQGTRTTFLIAEKPSRLRAIKSKRDQKHARRW